MDDQKQRVDGPHFSAPRPNLLDLQVDKTPDGLVVSARIDSRADESVLAQIEALAAQLNHLDPESAGEIHTHRFSMSADSSINPSGTLPSTDDVASSEDAVMESTEFSPLPPERTVGKILVRLSKPDRDKPLPAEDPWAQ